MASNYTVYCHTNKINGKRYVGITKQKPETRWNNGKGYKLTSHFGNAIAKYGWEEFTHEILFTGLTKEEAEAKEIELIAKWKLQDRNFGYNSASGGGINCDYRLSEETKLKIAKTNCDRGSTVKPKLKPCKNVFTENHKQKLHDANKKSFHPVICTTTGIIYENITAAVKDTEVNRCSIRRICKGERHMSKGLSFAWYKGGD